MHTEAISGTVFALGAYPVQVLGVAEQPPGALAAGMDEDVQGGGVVEGVVGAEDQALGTGDVGAVGGQARDGPAVLGVLSGSSTRGPPRARRRRAPRRRRRAAARCGEGARAPLRSGLWCWLGTGGCRMAGAPGSWAVAALQPRGPRPGSPRPKRRVRQPRRGRAGVRSQGASRPRARERTPGRAPRSGAARVGRQRGGPRRPGRRQVSAPRGPRRPGQRRARRWCCAPRAWRSRRRWRSRRCIGCCCR